MNQATSATVETGRSMFQGSSGRWATERLLAALQAGRGLSIGELRTCTTLSKDEWLLLDTALVEEAQIRLQGVADLLERGLVRRIPNGFGTTIFQWETLTDLDDAIVSMDGITKSENDRPDFSLNNLPLPFTHKDFNINIRTLEASRKRGESLDTTMARMSARRVAEKTEEMLFIGGKTFGGAAIYGYTTHPNRNTTTFGTGGTWTGTKTGEQILADVLAWFAILEADLMYGSYGLYISTAMNNFIAGDFKANSDKSTRQRLLEDPRLEFIKYSDKVPANQAVLVQLTPDVVQMIEGEPLQTIQWDTEGGFLVNFKAFQIMIPLIRADSDGRSGVVHIS